MLCGAVILQFRTALPPIFAAYICRLYLSPTFARLYLPPIFAAYILEIRLHFEQAPIFYACVNILRKRQYFDNFLQ